MKRKLTDSEYLDLIAFLVSQLDYTFDEAYEIANTQR